MLQSPLFIWKLLFLLNPEVDDDITFQTRICPRASPAARYILLPSLSMLLFIDIDDDDDDDDDDHDVNEKIFPGL